MNKHFLLGRTTKDIELTTLPSGVKKASFSLAVPSSRKDAEGNYITDFFYCVAWRETAENLAKLVKKGDRIATVGSMEPRTYEQNGKQQKIWEHNVREFYLAGGSTETKKQEGTTNNDLEPIDDDSLPF